MSLKYSDNHDDMLLHELGEEVTAWPASKRLRFLLPMESHYSGNFGLMPPGVMVVYPPRDEVKRECAVRFS